MRKPAAAKKTTTAAAAKPAVKAAAKKPAAKAVAKPAAKTVAKPAAKTPARKPVAKKAPVKKAAAPDAVREKAKKTRLVRDSFTMPEHEYEQLGLVKKACLKAGFEIKKSELLRIGVALIGQMDMATLQNVLASLPQLKTGRPKKS